MKLPIILFVIPAIFALVIPTAVSTQPTNKVNDYSSYLISLDKTMPGSIISARNELNKRFSSAPDSEAVKAFRAFNSFYSAVVNFFDHTYFWQNDKNTYRKDYQDALNEIITSNTHDVDSISIDDDPLQILDKQDAAFRKTLEAKYGNALKNLREFRKCGIRFSFSEGDWYAVKDFEFLSDAVAFLKGDYHDYLVFCAREKKKQIAEDGGLLISWDELRQKIIRYETFAVNHPNLPETDEEIRHELSRLFCFYLTGIDNTMAYDLYPGNTSEPKKTGAINPELRASYQIFLDKNKDSSFYPIIAKVWDILNRNNFSFCKELITYLNSTDYGDFVPLYRVTE